MSRSKLFDMFSFDAYISSNEEPKFAEEAFPL